jgi:hypothetical protein
MAKVLWYILGGTTILGLFLAVYTLVGIGIDPTDLFMNIGNQFAQTTNNLQVISFWNTEAGLIAIIGIFETISSIISYLLNGGKGIFVASSGFFGIVSFILGKGSLATWVGIGLFAIGCLVCYFSEGEAPEDMFTATF